MNPQTPIPESSSTQQQFAVRLAEFRALRARGALCTEVTEQLAAEAASVFLSHYRERGEYLSEAITLLAEIATLEEPCLAQPGQQATFPVLVEHLSDSFEPQYCSLYDRAFAQMISVCRRLPSAQDLDHALRRFGLHSEDDLLERKARLRQRQPMLDGDAQQKVRKVLVLSRVTLGADVAITSVVWQKAKKVFPQAERILLGSPKLRELFGGDPSLRVREVRYETEGSLLGRLRNWLPLVEAVDDELRSLQPGEYLLIDPDSRLLQLGLLPALDDESRYFFFESRCFGEPGQGSLSEITLGWLHGQFGGPDKILPAVRLLDPDRVFARGLCRKLRQDGAEYLVAASFGVGGNPQKRLPDPLEQHLLLELLAEGCTVLLDKGFGKEEIGRANDLIEQVRAKGWTVTELNPASAQAATTAQSLGCRMLVWQGGIGAFSALVGESDEYVGYDSAGQHIAAALGVPTLDLFSRNASAVFQERWRPTGCGVVKTVTECAPDGTPRPVRAILAEVMAQHREIRSAKQT